jgi:hypothetical protein
MNNVDLDNLINLYTYVGPGTFVLVHIVRDALGNPAKDNPRAQVIQRVILRACSAVTGAALGYLHTPTVLGAMAGLSAGGFNSTVVAWVRGIARAPKQPS